MPRVQIAGGPCLEAPVGENLLALLRGAGAAVDAPCNGEGRCGKCRVLVNGRAALACRTAVEADVFVALPERERPRVLSGGERGQVSMNPLRDGLLVAFDVGTTTLVCYLLDGATGERLATAGMLNPQVAYGADVITRIRCALHGDGEELCRAVREGMSELLRRACAEAGASPSEIGVVSVVGNPCMQQLFLGLPVDNLARMPFAPALTRADVVPAAEYLPECGNALMMIVPDVSGFVGADTLGCALATGLREGRDVALVVDIGTNGEMLLAGRGRMLACATAAGPALEGVGIRCGMRAAAGAIDRAWAQGGELRWSTIDGEQARGICGSGLIDLAAALLETGGIDRRGRIQSREELNGQRFVRLTDAVYLTQEDIRALQLAKGAIAAGIELMCAELGVAVEEIDRVLLAGAFGNHIRPESACRIGLLPPALQKRILPVGNAAGSGACMLACDREQLQIAGRMAREVEFLELAALPGFRRSFAKNMYF